MSQKGALLVLLGTSFVNFFILLPIIFYSFYIFRSHKRSTIISKRHVELLYFEITAVVLFSIRNIPYFLWVQDEFNLSKLAYSSIYIFL